MSPSRVDQVPSEDVALEQVTASVAAHHADLSDIHDLIHSNPELRYEEYQAHNNICNLLEKLEHSVVRHAYGLETAFEAEFGSGGRLVVFNAEYDALPGMGHACGHSLIATSSIAAFIATAEMIAQHSVAGRVRILGTPAEESGGGKIKLIKAGAYNGVDACLMAHPGPSEMKDMGAKTAVDGVSATRSLARKQVKVTFTGRNAHAGLAPWHGRNALDAVVASYVNISLLRQQIPPSARIHGVIRQGGTEPNIIPDSATLEYFIRDNDAASVDRLGRRVQKCFEAGSMATECDVLCEWNDEADYKDLRPNMTIAERFTKKMSLVGRNYLCDGRAHEMGASTDMGNVTYEVPGFHCGFSVGSEVPDASPHDSKFTIASSTQSALKNALDCAVGMALTAFDILVDDEMFAQMQMEHMGETVR